MNPTLDLNILPVYRQDGQDQPELPDLYAVTPPRRPARGRESDSLILYLSVAGNFPLPPEQLNQLLSRLAHKFYKTTGSVTAAMRKVAEAINGYLLDRNMRSSSAGKQGVGLLILTVLHADTIYLAHCGPVHSFLIASQDTQHMYDPQGSGRGLGLSRTTPIRFFQIRLQLADFLLLSAQAPAGWTASSLRHSQRLGLEGMRRQMLNSAGQELNTTPLKAALIQAQPGDGKLRLLRRKAGVEDMAHIDKEEEAAPEMRQPAEFVPLQAAPPPVIPVVEPTGWASRPQATPPPKQTPASSSEVIASSGLRRAAVTRPTEATPGVAAAPPATQQSHRRAEKKPAGCPAGKRLMAPVLSAFAAIGRALGSALDTLGRGLGSLFKNMLPDESLLHLSPSVMIFFALAVPLVLSTVGGMVYIQRGRASQHQFYYDQAFKAAGEAILLSDATQQRAAWQSVLDDLDEAEFYKVTPESQALRAQAQAALDDLNGNKRLGFQPAILGGLGSSVEVTQIVATATDLYMLNSDQGNVMRAVLTGRGYEIDTQFNCGRSFGSTIVGPLVDIAALPFGSAENATILGMDANGNVLYCYPDGVQPKASALAPPNTNFGEPKAMTLDEGDLYVLDPKVNAVWIYRGMDFTQQPRLFFGDDIPPMQDVVDLAVNNDDLFLLHTDGHVTKCTYSVPSVSPTRCEDPFSFQDTRPGRQDGAVIVDAVFSQIYFSPPPDPSIYMLDPNNQAIYHFSVRLAFQRQFRTLDEFSDGRATSFAVSPNRRAFIAVGNEVYYAAMP